MHVGTHPNLLVLLLFSSDMAVYNLYRPYEGQLIEVDWGVKVYEAIDDLDRRVSNLEARPPVGAWVMEIIKTNAEGKATITLPEPVDKKPYVNAICDIPISTSPARVQIDSWTKDEVGRYIAFTIITNDDLGKALPNCDVHITAWKA